jgi:hypothetical protein
MRSLRTFMTSIAMTLFIASVHAQTPDAAATTSTPKEMIVYDTALGDGWQNWSWAKAELSVELGGSARKPIRVTAGPWQAMYLHHEAFNTTGLKKLSLLIQGSAPDGEVRIFALADGKVIGEGYLVKLSNSGWKLVEQPLSVLGAEDKVIDGLWVQNASGADLPKFYVTEIKLQ